MKNELFLFGHPCFLSGGAKTKDRSVSYDSATSYVGVSDQTVVTPDLSAGETMVAPKRLCEAAGQTLFHGMGSYHGRQGTANRFAAEDCWPTVGAEIETVARECPRDDMYKALVSNWFWLERDGSLPDGTGHECVTAPLSRRHWGSPELWLGLQNALSPWLYSWDCDRTGLHVHVGLDRFEDIEPDLPISLDKSDRRMLGALASAYVYMKTPQALVNRVFQRRRGDYCGADALKSGSGPLAAVFASPDATGVCARLVETAEAMSDHTMQNLLTGAAGAGISGVVRRSGLSTHGCEINFAHPYTVEFRRGKGTLNGLSIHRMVEFCACCAKFAEHIVSDHSFRPTVPGFLEFVEGNTNSAVLAADAREFLGKENAECA